MIFVRTLALLLLVFAGALHAAPNLPLEEVDWVLLRDARARGLLPDLLGGAQLLGEDQVQAALGLLRLAPDLRLLPASQEGFWLRPLERAALRALALDEHDRPYSLEVRPRHLAGQIGLSCEFQEGRPCGGGLGLVSELDSSAGVGSWLSGTTRLRLDLGNNGYQPALRIDRAYLKAQLGAVALEAGRDTLALGPSARSGLMVTQNAAPLDQLRAWTRPFALPFLDADALRVSFFYCLARLRQPQTFDGTLLQVTRMQLDLFKRIELGGTRLLQFGGKGAPAVGFEQFVALQFTRRYDSQQRPLSDNRLAFDLSVSVPELAGGRIYAEFASEDFRKQELNVLHYEADYLIGAEARALGLGPLQRLLIEATKSGRLSQEGLYWLTGWTNAGRTLGTSLGPDGLALYLRAELELPFGRVSPWVESVRFSSDTYKDDGLGDGGIQVDQSGPAERRQRAGLDLSIALRQSLRLEATAWAERVTNVDLRPGAERFNAGALAALRYAADF